MDFTQSLKKAMALGVTKEEFMRLWEAETRAKLENMNGKDVFDNHTPQVWGNQNFDGRNEGVDQTKYQWQQTKEELRKDLFVKFEQMFNQHMVKQEMIWERVHSRNDQTTEEFRKKFEILCQHVSNTVESQGAALKLLIIQEFELLKQSITKIIDERCSSFTAESPLSGASFDHSNHQDANSQENHYEFSNVKDGFNGQTLKSKTNTTTGVQMYESVQQAEKSKGHHLPESTDSWNLKDQVETTVIQDEYKENSGNVNRSAWGIRSTQYESHDKDSSRYAQALLHNTNNSGTSKHEIDRRLTNSQPAVPQQADSTEATGFYADIISSQMKQSHSSDSSLSSSSRKNIQDDEEIKAIVYASVHASGKPGIYNKFEKFVISDSDKFSASCSEYLSPFMYSRTKSWKAQACVSFNAAKELKIRLLISKGDIDSDQEWPLKFTGSGEIYHQGSKRFTQIWHIPPKICQKPSATGIIIVSAVVSLSTTRGQYPDIKYDELKLRHYAEKNELIFQWNLKAEKLSKGSMK